MTCYALREAHCKRYIAVLDETLHADQQLPVGQHSIEPSVITGSPAEQLIDAPTQRMLIVTMCSRDAKQACKLLQRALARIASRALDLETVAVVVASSLSEKVRCCVLSASVHR